MTQARELMGPLEEGRASPGSDSPSSSAMVPGQAGGQQPSGELGCGWETDRSFTKIVHIICDGLLLFIIYYLYYLVSDIN